jgi:hypothetical protein
MFTPCTQFRSRPTIAPLLLILFDCAIHTFVWIYPRQHPMYVFSDNCSYDILRLWSQSPSQLPIQSKSKHPLRILTHPNDLSVNHLPNISLDKHHISISVDEKHCRKTSPVEISSRIRSWWRWWRWRGSIRVRDGDIMIVRTVTWSRREWRRSSTRCYDCVCLCAIAKRPFWARHWYTSGIGSGYSGRRTRLWR